ncbi:transglycosylase domain-containing protein [Mucilaginibacter myungsuensis]|uniref:Transglycosylase domain-containing protein n=1 Tax=Mucilaginibacter myungsuensis TaxID=649104 RepID=A0A929PXK7_9SPHI|nr:transglycosylase domain-containing protein [Mucilaginibacter myungsuensis]MBE9663963.1 transglycosylase domain-containing protein [Mucilaginibacter myungsuensis]MDN3598321.1 transglycosylase domain-containing protein [Mucilaginibacter myungsuensis]
MIIKLSQQDIRRYNRMIWKIVIGGFVIFLLIISAVGLGLFGKIRSFDELANPKSNLASEVLSDDGKTPLGSYYLENRSPVTYKQLGDNVIHALVATEDKRFYDHSGIDFQRMFTILIKNLVKRQGGSTITQQLAKNWITKKDDHTPRVIQKLKEWITAVKLERNYTKEEIITMYFNTVDFGAYNTYGIKSAARTYFSTTPDKLTPDQAALLVGMVNGPGIFSPIRHPDNALRRRNIVLQLMADANYLGEDQANSFKEKPMGLKFHRIDHNEGLAPYFRDAIKSDIQKILVDKQIFKSDGTPYDLDRDGLKIYTTVNADMQQYAEEAQATAIKALQAEFNSSIKGANLYKRFPNLKKLLQTGMFRSDRYKWLELQGKSADEIRENFNTPDTLELFSWKGKIDTVMKPIDSIIYTKMLLRNAMMSMDPTTGYIKAWVGGINFEHFKYDQVRKGKRQVGSTAKPFTYAVAIEQGGFSPCNEFDNVPDTIYTPGSAPWAPRSSGTIAGRLTLRRALANSQNWITAALMKIVTPLPVKELIEKAGVPNIPEVPSICLGAFDASVFDMTGAYTIFANGGLWNQPNYLLRIEDKNGNVLYTHHGAVKQVLNPQSAYVMNYMLKGVIDEGTGWRLRGKYKVTAPIGGKTGTTNDNSDGWFIGFTPQLVTGVWTGFEDRDIHFRDLKQGEGANSALPVFAYYMQKVYANDKLGIKKNVDFVKPPNVDIVTDCGLYNQDQQAPAAAEKKLGF